MSIAQLTYKNNKIQKKKEKKEMRHHSKFKRVYNKKVNTTYIKPLLVSIFFIVCALDACDITAVVVQLECVETVVSLNKIMFLIYYLELFFYD